MSPTEQALSVISYEQEIAPVVAGANNLVIKNQEQSLGAQEILKEIKRRQKRVEEVFDPIVASAHNSWKKTCDTRASFLNPLKEAEGTIKKKVIAYETEAERKRQEAAAKAEAERQEKERKEREKLEQKAQIAEIKGNTEKAELLRDQAASVSIAPTFEPQASSKAQGTSFKSVWRAEVTDIKALCQSIIDGKLGTDVIEVVPSKLNRAAEFYKGAAQVPGVRFFEEKNMSVRAVA